MRRRWWLLVGLALVIVVALAVVYGPSVGVAGVGCFLVGYVVQGLLT